MLSKQVRRLSMLVGVSALALTSGSSYAAEAKHDFRIIAEEKYSENSTDKIYIYEDPIENERCIAFEHPSTAFTRQSCVHLTNPEQLWLEYQQLSFGAFLLNPNIENTLVIGLGGGIAPMHLSALSDNIKVDTVEISPSVAKVAKKYFNFTESDRVKLFIEDAFKFVADAAKSGKKYDLILMDAFSKDYVPPQFFSDEFILNMKSILSDKGIIAVTTFPGSPYEQKENDLYQKHFGWFYNLVGSERIIMVGPKVNTDTIKHNAQLWHGKFKQMGFDSLELAKKFDNTYPNT